jgi:hypothetical protein
MWKASRTNIIKQILAFALVALAINVACVTSVPAQSSKEVERVQKVRRSVNGIGIGENVEVKTLDGAKLKGQINEIGEDYLVVADNKTGNVTRLTFAQVKQVKARADNPLADPGALLGLAFIPVIIAAVILSRGK